MNDLTKKVSLLGAGVVVGAASFTAIGASAQTGEEGEAGRHQRGEIVSEVLGVEKQELREAKQSGQTFEEIVTSNGFDSVEDFEAAMETAIREKLAEQGLSDEEIDEKIAIMQERKAVREDVRDTRQSVLGLSREEVKEKLEAGMSMDEILAETGFDDKQAVRDAVSGSLTELWSNEGVSEDEIEERLERLENRGDKRGFHGRHGFGPHQGADNANSVEA